MRIEGYLSEHTTDDALQAMAHYAKREYTHPKIKGLAHDLVIGINPNDQRSQMIAILNWVKKNLKYVTDEHEAQRLFGTSGDLEMIKSPTAVLRSGRYDCDCVSTLIAAMMLSLGIKVRFVVVGFHEVELTGPDGFEHVYVQGFDEQSSKWLIIDPVSHPSERQMILDTRQSKIYDIL